MKKTIRLFTTVMVCMAMALCVSCKKDNAEPNGGGNTGGGGTGGEISGCFSVSSTTTVEFAPGNLYWDGSAFKFEANQWSFADTLNANHVSHFYWSKDAAEATKESFNYEQSMSTEDEFFTNSSSFQVAGETAGTWRTLSKDEWDYLLNSRTDASSLRAWKELDSGTHKGLVILSDGTDASVMESISSTADLATYGAVFLPAAGMRYGTYVYDVGSYDRCWSGTPREDIEGSAYIMYFDSGSVLVGSSGRTYGSSVRLVR